MKSVAMKQPPSKVVIIINVCLFLVVISSIIVLIAIIYAPKEKPIGNSNKYMIILPINLLVH